MTLQIIDVTSNAVNQFCDTAARNLDETIGGFFPKATPLPHQHAIVACNGTTFLHSIAVATLSEANNFAELCVIATTKLREILTASQPLLVPRFGEHACMGTIIVAGWANGPVAWLMTTHDGIGSLPPWQINKINGRFITPSSTTIEKDFGMDVPLDDERAIALAERCRSVTDHGGVNAGKYIVGGSLVRTTIDSNGIHTRVLKRWLDKTGKSICVAA